MSLFFLRKKLWSGVRYNLHEENIVQNAKELIEQLIELNKLPKENGLWTYQDVDTV